MDKFWSKNSKIFILTENWHTWYVENADSYSNNIFWIADLKSIFGQIWLKKSKVKAVCLAWKLEPTCIHTQYLEDVDSYFDINFLKFQTLILRMLILIRRLVFWNSEPKFIFWTNLSQKIWIIYFSWKLVHRVSWGPECKNTEQRLEEKTKMNNYIKCLLLLYLYLS